MPTAAAPVAEETPFVTADEWFAAGKRVLYDHKRKEIAPEKRRDETIPVFHRVVVPKYSNPDALWLTMLPGFPYGSYGCAKVETMLQSNKKLISDIPRLYVEYVGQGNSDKPKDGYTYSTIERANLVEAHWKAQGVKTTVLVTMDFSSLVMLELLQRQKAREEKGIRFPRVEHVLSGNGGYFVDGHSNGAVLHTPLVRSTFGSMSSSAAQRSTMVFNKILLPLYSKEYRKNNAKLFKQEIKETQKAIRLHQGSRIMAQMAHFVDEHKTKVDRWNLLSIYQTYCKEQGISFHIMGSEQDPFEGEQLALVQDRLKAYANKVHTERIPGGHPAAQEQAALLVSRIVDMVQKGKSPVKQAQQQRTWTQLEAPTYNKNSWTSPRTAHMDYGLAF
ncbi:hypothetical protein ACA910_012117 [Epithemia clementina (nom. ined.)]